MSSVPEQNQLATVGEMVTLYEVDMGILDPGTLLRFTADTDGSGSAILFGGETYVPLPIEAEGFAWEANAAFPRPKVRLSNVGNALTALLANFDELVGVEFRRIKTYSRFLDDGSEPDSTNRYPDEIWEIDRLVNQNPVFVEFELLNPADQEGRVLPGRTVMKDGCSHKFRIYDPDLASEPNIEDRFNYRNATCPYDGPLLFDVFGNPVSDPSTSGCGKHVRDCKLYFSGQTLPTYAFPGVGRVR